MTVSIILTACLAFSLSSSQEAVNVDSHLCNCLNVETDIYDEAIFWNWSIISDDLMTVIHVTLLTAILILLVFSSVWLIETSFPLYCVSVSEAWPDGWPRSSIWLARESAVSCNSRFPPLTLAMKLYYWYLWNTMILYWRDKWHIWYCCVMLSKYFNLMKFSTEKGCLIILNSSMRKISILYSR